MTEEAQLTLTPAESLLYEDALLALDELPPDAELASPAPTADFVRNIKARGVINPILVQEKADGAYHVLAGKRRVKAARKAGKTHIPARIYRQIDHWDAVTIESADNAGRRPNDLSDLMVLMRLKDAGLPLSLSMLPKGTIRKRLSIMGLEPAFHQAVRENRVSISTALSLAKLSASERKPLLEQVSQGKKVSGKDVAQVRWAKTTELASQANLPAADFEYDAADLYMVLDADLTVRPKKHKPARSYDEALALCGKNGRIFKLVEM
jgi:ParB-like chromosome segregation protein Spo0J